MKLRNFANKLLLIAFLGVICCGYLATSCLTSLPLTLTTASTENEGKVYFFDQYNYNRPTRETLYENLGVLDYNEYLGQIGAEEVVVAVVDTGLDSAHAVFQNRILSQYAVDFSRGIPSQDTNYWNQDDKGHGTHVAGIIADMTLPNVKILPVKIFYGLNNNGSNYAFENAVRYLCALKTGKRVGLLNNNGQVSSYYTPTEKLENLVAVNLSLGTKGYWPESAEDMAGYNNLKPGFQSVIDHLVSCEILPVVAAGNRTSDEKDGVNKYKTYYCLPGTCEGSLTVSAYDNTSAQYSLADFSYFNEYVTVSAPGVEIWSACSQNIVNLLSKSKRTEHLDSHGRYTYYKYNDSVGWYIRQDADGNYYLRDNGTSMATPFVTACYAMLYGDTSKHQAADYGLSTSNQNQSKSGLVQQALVANAATNGVHLETGYSEEFGYGTVSLVGLNVDNSEQLDEVAYEIPKVNVPWWNDTYSESDGKTDWRTVCIILLVSIVIIRIINSIRTNRNRREEYDNNIDIE